MLLGHSGWAHVLGRGARALQLWKNLANLWPTLVPANPFLSLQAFPWFLLLWGWITFWKFASVSLTKKMVRETLMPFNEVLLQCITWCHKTSLDFGFKFKISQMKGGHNPRRCSFLHGCMASTAGSISSILKGILLKPLVFPWVYRMSVQCRNQWPKHALCWIVADTFCMSLDDHDCSLTQASIYTQPLVYICFRHGLGFCQRQHMKLLLTSSALLSALKVAVLGWAVGQWERTGFVGKKSWIQLQVELEMSPLLSASTLENGKWMVNGLDA